VQGDPVPYAMPWNRHLGEHVRLPAHGERIRNRHIYGYDEQIHAVWDDHARRYPE
jgi:hypothetical protein